MTPEAGKDAAKAVWGASPAGTTFAGGAEPGSREFFERALRIRTAEEQSWLFDLVPFEATRAKKVIEIGCGVGFDAYEFCRNGADYTGIDLTPENIDRAKAHLGRLGLHASFIEADAESLPFQDATFDFAYSNGVLHHIPDISRGLSEVTRVLRRRGVFWVVLYHRNSIVHWITLFAWGHILKGGYRKRSFSEWLQSVETTTSDARPIVNVYSRGDVARLLTKSGLEVRRIWVRKLSAHDLPGGQKRWGWVPQRLLDRVGRRWGWYVIAHATKP